MYCKSLALVNQLRAAAKKSINGIEAEVEHTALSKIYRLGQNIQNNDL